MIKNHVLLALEKSKGKPVSGSSLAKQLNVSRTAIWKTINNLKEEGFEITSVAKKGYMLSTNSDILSTQGIMAELENKDINLVFLESTDSTNKQAMEIALNNPKENTIVISNEQTQGKGRLGRNFYSPKDAGIYVSFILKPFNNPSKSIKITTAAAVAVVRAIKEITHREASIKWVNDIFLDNKKICGILTEAVSDFESNSISHIILGIGLNCKKIELPKELQDIAGAIDGDFSRNKLAASIIKNVYNALNEIDEESLMIDYKQNSMVIGKEVIIYKGGIKTPENAENVEVLDIDANGGLVIKHKNGEKETLLSGEISLSVI